MVNLSQNTVSIITPCFNASHFIDAAITSVQNQTYPYWEMIIVDDCSTDRSVELVERRAAEDSRIRLIRHSQRCGVAAARNTALEAAIGRYVAFLDGDDYWLPFKIEYQLQFMQKRDIAFSCTLFRHVNELGDKCGAILNAPEYFDYTTLLKNTGIGCLTVMIDRIKLGPVHFNNVLREDFVLWLRLLKKGTKAYVLQTDLARYRRVRSSKSWNKILTAASVWRIYRNAEKLSFSYSLWCFVNYAWHAYKRRRSLGAWRILYKPRLTPPARVAQRRTESLKEPKIAVIMSIYRNDKLQFIKQSIEGILGQTYRAFDIYLKLDGSISRDIEDYLQTLANDKIKIFKRDLNRGLAHSLNELVEVVLVNSQYRYIARMDADDISRPDRFAKQVNFLEKNNDVAIVGSWCEEIDEANTFLFLKKLPLDHLAIKRDLVKRNPLVHTSVMIRTSLFEKGLRYNPNYYLSEDYFLWIQAIINKYKMANIPEPLIQFRVDNNFFKRRSGFRKATAEFKCKLFFQRHTSPFNIENYLWVFSPYLLKTGPELLMRYLYRRMR